MKITKNDFLEYEQVRQSGVTNMFNTHLVSQLTGLEREQLVYIMKNYSKLNKKYLKKKGG